MDTVIWESIGILICLIGSAFFSSSETALTSLSGPQTQKMVEDGASRSLQLWLDHPIKVLTAILIGNNILNITASALATDLANRLLEGTSAAAWAIPVAVGVMTFLLLTFGEITPKAIAKKMYKQVAAPMMILLQVPYILFYPATLVFSQMTRRIMTWLGNDPSQKAPFVTAEEIEYMIDLGSREGTFSEDRERMLRSVFEFNDTMIREIMVPRTDAVFLSEDMDLDEIVELLIQCGHSRLPVYEETVDNIIGIFYAKDLIKIVGHAKEVEAFDIRAFLHKPFFVPESKRIADLFTEFQRQRIHMAIVVDEFGGTDGLITLEDIVEEFFGEIQDEYDIEPEQLIPISEDLLRADARVPIYEIEEYFEVDLPEEKDYETLGGFLMSQSGTVPEAGEEVLWKNLLFRVLEADEKKVISVEIAKIERLDEDSEPLEQLVG
ncbi:MAG: hemolysin family protein [Myxococcota bacterium]|nr:hemolysin family protein [Myxococcota bacterium]